jgi:hypothetical protein
MTPLALAAVWVAAGLLGTAAARLAHRRRVAILAPAIAGALGGAAAVAAAPGPLASIRFGATLELSRPELGLLVVVGPAVALTLALAPHIDGGEVLSLCLAGAASVVAMGATVPIVWAIALAVGIGAIALRWISATPNRATLAAGRVAGLGAAALLAGAVVVPSQAPPSDVRAALAGALLAGGVGALVGLVPAGGWAAGATSAVRGADLAAWGLILAPAILLSASAASSGLTGRTADTYADVLLVLGLLSAVYGGAQAVLTQGVPRYGRLLLADIGLAAAGIGCRQEAGQLGVLLILLAHLCAGPLLLNPPRPGIERAHRLAWLALSGLPPSVSFWGRLLVLQGLVATSGLALLAALAAGAAMLVAAMRGVVHPQDATEGPAAEPPLRVLGWALAVAAIALGFAPAWAAGHLFGVDLGAG